MGIKEILQRIRERKEERRGFERQQRIMENFEERKLSSDERELNAIMEKRRQERIKEILKRIREREERKHWSGRENNAINAPNVVANHKKLFGSGNMFAHVPNVAKQPNVFQVANIFNRRDNFFRGGV